MNFGVWGLGFEFWGLGFGKFDKIWLVGWLKFFSGFGVWGSGFGVWGLTDLVGVWQKKFEQGRCVF